MTKKLAIGIDVGATNYRMGAVSAAGEVLKLVMKEVGRKRRPSDIVQLLSVNIAALKKEYGGVEGVGIGIPGIVDKEDGVVYQSPHYPDWVDVNFKKLLSDAFQLPVILDNDANQVAIGEGWLGAGAGLPSFLMLTLGTGIGGGIVVDGRIWHGDHGFAGEVGHILVDFNGPLCDCGSHGCLEMYSSATGLKYLVRASDQDGKDKVLKAVNGDYDKITPEMLYALAKEGDIFASVIWKKFGAYLGAGLASLVNCLGIMNIIIGGGISRAWDFFIAETRREFGRRTYKQTTSLVHFIRAKLGDNAGVLGGARGFF